jgi:inhibitor of KinA sporulation pathway (predicted exonuclease)
MSHFFIVDLEATCGPNLSHQDSEVIEIAALYRNLKESSRTWQSIELTLRPAIRPILTPFCMELTGLSQQIVDWSLLFDRGIRTFDLWRQSCLQSDLKPKVYWGSWGEFDRKQMDREFERHCIPHFDWQHLNLRTIYCQSNGLPKHSKSGLVNLLDKLGLPFPGQPHRALSDCRAIEVLFENDPTFFAALLELTTTNH